MKLICEFLIIFFLFFSQRSAYAYWHNRGTRHNEDCGFNTRNKCGPQPYCPYPDTILQIKNYGFTDYCCCAPATFQYQYRMTEITARCGAGVPMQPCEDFPYCESGSFYRVFDRCCCT